MIRVLHYLGGILIKYNKKYRFRDNPDEKVFHDNFIKEYDINSVNIKLSGLVFGWKDMNQDYPKDYLSEREQDICLNLIQWVGSPVGQGFLDSCGFIKKG